VIVCVGAGPGHLDYLTRGGAKRIEEADVVAGFTYVVDMVRPLISEAATIITMGYKDQTERIAELAALHQAGKTCVVVFMGDIHFSGFQFLERVEKACGHPVETFPGISSAQVTASRGRVCFDETTFVTFHRRGDLTPFREHLLHVLQDGRNAIVIPRPWDFMPKEIAAYLLSQGRPPEQPVELWEHLTAGESHWSGALAELTGDFSDLSIMLIRSVRPLPTGLEGEKF
jgi:cobalt-precorrin-7 (C5)-methyltransferase